MSRIRNSAAPPNDSKSAAIVKFANQLAQHYPHDVEVAPSGDSERSLNSRFNGTGSFAIQGPSLSCQSQQPSTPVASVGPPTDQTPTLQPLQNGRKRTGVQVQNVSQLPRVDARKASDDPDHQPLRACDAKRCRHRPGSALERVVDGPDQAQEVDRVADRQRGLRGTRAARRVSHGGRHAV